MAKYSKSLEKEVKRSVGRVGGGLALPSPDHTASASVGKSVIGGSVGVAGGRRGQSRQSNGPFPTAAAADTPADLLLCKCGHPPRDHQRKAGCLVIPNGDPLGDFCACDAYEVEL